MLKRTGLSYGFDKVTTPNGREEIQLNMAKNEAKLADIDTDKLMLATIHSAHGVDTYLKEILKENDKYIQII